MGERGLVAAGYRDEEHFILEWHDRIGYQLRRLKVPLDEIDDRRQEVYVRMWQTGHLGKYNPDITSFPYHVFTVCRSVAVNAWKRKQKRALDLATYSFIEASPADAMTKVEFRSVKILELMSNGAPSIEDCTAAKNQLAILKKGLSEGYVWSRKTQATAEKAFGPDTKNTLWQVAVWLFVDGHRVGDLAIALGVQHGSVSNWKRRVSVKSKEILLEVKEEIAA